MLTAPLLTLAQATAKSDEQLRLLLRGYFGIVLIAVIGALGLAMILALAVLWRRSLKRQRRLETQISEMRAAGASMGDAWAAAARRVEVSGGRRAHEQDEEEDVAEEEDDPYNLFGGRDPMEGVAEDEEDGFDDEDDGAGDDFDGEDDAPPGYRR